MSTLKYDFTITGANAVRATLRGVEKDIARLNRKARGSGGGASSRGTGGSLKPAEASRMRHREQMLAKRQAGQIALVERREATRTHHHRERLIQKEAAARIRAETRASARASSSRARLAGRFTRGGLRRVGAVGSSALQMAGLAGGVMFSSAVSAERSKHRNAAALANQAFGTDPAGSRSREELKSQVLATGRAVGTSTGLGADPVIGAMRQFHGKAGNIDAATDLAGFMADVSDASGADMTDVGEFAGQTFMSALAQGMDPDEAKAAVKEILSVAAGQAKSGAIELRDLASQGGKLLSASGRFGGDLGSLANTMGAVGQLAIAGGAASPDEAMTSLMRFADDLGKKGGTRSFTKHGIDVFADDSKTSLRNPAELIMESISKTGGAIPDLGKMFGARGMKAVEPFRKMYVEAGRGEAGAKAMRDAFERFTKLKMSPEELADSAAFTRSQDDRKFNKAMEDFKDAVGQQLLPVLTELVPKLAEMTPQVARAAENLANLAGVAIENPGAAITAAIVAAIATEAIGHAAATALTGVLMAAGATISAAVAAALAGAVLAGYNAYKANEEAGERHSDIERERSELLKNATALGEDIAVREKGTLDFAFGDAEFGGDKEFLIRGFGGGVKTFGSREEAQEALGRNAPVSIPLDTKVGDGLSKAAEQTERGAAATVKAAAALEVAAGKLGNAPGRGDSPTTPSPTSPRP
jgi:hypothetical protein